MNLPRLGASSAFGLILCAYLQIPNSYSQEITCEKLFPLPGSQSGYQKRANRCEGLYVTNAAVDSLAATSFTFGDLGYDLRADKRLLVSVPGQSVPVNVRAVAIPPRTYYRMDAIVRPGSVLLWPVAEVLAREDLTADRIGVFGWRGTGISRTILPVLILAHVGATHRGPPILTVQASFDSLHVKWRSAAVANDQCKTFGPWRDASRGPLTANWPVRINLAAIDPGTHCLTVAAESAGAGWNTSPMRIEIPTP
jgi:hypothetical protein